MKYVLDTNIFNCLLDGRLSLSALPSDSEFIVTNVQLRELEATSDSFRRTQLLHVFNQVSAEHVLTESFAYDIPGSGYDESKWNSDGGKRITSIKDALDSLKRKPNNWQDAIITEVALVNGYGLITADSNLAIVAMQHKIHVYKVAT